MKKFFLMPLCLVFLLSACGPGNIVKLLPPPPLAASSLPAPGAPSICVVQFKDERTDPAVIGIRRDNTSFTTHGNVPVWISRALADELARKGFRVTFATQTKEGRAANPDYLVTGIVKEIWLKENSATEMTVKMQINCTLANRKGKLWTETCNSSQSRSSLPSGSIADNLMLDTLQELIKPIAGKIVSSVEKSSSK